MKEKIISTYIDPKQFLDLPPPPKKCKTFDEWANWAGQNVLLTEDKKRKNDCKNT